MTGVLAGRWLHEGQAQGCRHAEQAATREESRIETISRR
jgi:hypothetical protein